MEILKLTNETIDLLSEKIEETYRAAGCSKKEMLRARLLLEEALLKYQSRLGSDVELYFRSYRILGQHCFTVRLRSPAFDPFTLEENPMAFMIKTISNGFESGMPTWKYKNLENELTFTIARQKKVGSLAKVAIAVIAAVILGMICRLCLPQSALAEFVRSYIDPISDAYAGLFCVMAVLLTFFDIALSIIHIGDLASVSALGVKLMLRYFLICAIAAVALSLPILPLFDFGRGGDVSMASKTIFDILIAFIPANLVEPFLNFNSVHIMLIAAMFGFSLLTLGQRGSGLVEIFSECNMVAACTNGFLNRFIFIYIALKLFSVITSSDLSGLACAGQMLIFILIAELILVLIYTVRLRIRSGLPLRRFVRAFLPASVICLSSANFGAAFSSVYEAVTSFGVNSDTARIALNLGSVFFQPACTTVLVFSSLFMASAFHVEISVIWIVMAVLLSVILVSSMPNTPGASIAVITLLFAQLGIPAEALSIMIAVNALLQFVTVAVDAWCLMAEVFCMDSAGKETAAAA